MFGAKMPAQQIFLIAAAPLAVGLIVALAITPLYKRQIAGQGVGTPALPH
jgi:hypothetical protein